MRNQHTKYTYVNYWGDVYRLTATQWSLYLRAIAAGDLTTPASYGHYVHGIHHDVSSITAEQALAVLAGLRPDNQSHEPQQA